MRCVIRTKQVVLIALIFSVLSACDVPLPISEMAEARNAISTAKKYSADKYAKDEIAAAEKLLLDAHTQVKDDKQKDATDTAIKAREKAEAAYVKALPLLTQDTLAKASNDIAEAKGFGAAEFAADDIKNAESEYTLADQSFKKTLYIESLASAQKASQLASRAREGVMSRIPVLRGKIAALEAEYDELIMMEADIFAKDDMKSLAALILSAKENVTAGKVKETTVVVTNASSLIEKIRETGIASSTRKKILKAEDSAAELSALPDASEIAVEIDTARAKIKEANTLFERKEYSSASARADEAQDILDGAANVIEKLLAARNLSPSPDETGKDSAEKVEDAKDTSAVQDTINEYVVQWRKKNTDCLWRIAEKVYKNANLWPLIYMANRDQIKDPDLIYPGQKFVIPRVPVREKKEPEDKGSEPAKEAATPEAKGSEQPVPTATATPKGSEQIKSTASPSPKGAEHAKPAATASPVPAQGSEPSAGAK